MPGLSVGKLVNGMWRQTATVQSYTAPYQQTLLVVASGATGNQLNGPVTSGTSITLPGAQAYNSTELLVALNGQLLVPTVDYSYVSTTQISLTQTLITGDYLEFVITRQF